jgi:dolichyl-phosphate-mannose-protein mannosyltransferase
VHAAVQGQWFSAIDGYKVYLLGNPIIWWGNIVIMVAFIVVYGINKFLEKRGKLSLSQQGISLLKNYYCLCIIQP